jgi:hypothetical protein
MTTTPRVGHGVGVVRIAGTGVWALWVLEHFRAETCRDVRVRIRVRVSLDEFDRLGLNEYERVPLKVGGQAERLVYFRHKRDAPPFCWLEFGDLLGW